MTQHYEDPTKIGVPDDDRRAPRSLLRILERDGQIVPLLVRFDAEESRWFTDDMFQVDRVLAFRELGWPTVLIEDEWTEDDL